MIHKIDNIKLTLEQQEGLVQYLACKQAEVSNVQFPYYRIVKKSIDARNKASIKRIYTVEIADKPFDVPTCPINAKAITSTKRPIIVGFGPSGIFSALELVRQGIIPIIIERGDSVDNRLTEVERFWLNGSLNVNTNVQFGEGGAGTFSDGKLNTNLNTPHNQEVLQTLVYFGAPSEILYLGKPHIGTDKLVDVVRNIRKYLIEQGVEIHFNTLVTELVIDNDTIVGVVTSKGNFDASKVILCIGHSARDTYAMLASKRVDISPKPFSVGVRIEHKQSDIDFSQYGQRARHTNLPPAEYKLATHYANGRSAYTFCMCPGGEVVSASSATGEIAINGMSNFKRDGQNANCAVLVNVTPDDYGYKPLDGVNFATNLERSAYNSSGSYKAPVQLVGDFLADKNSTSFGDVKPTYKNGTHFFPMASLLPNYVTETLKHAIADFDVKLRGFGKNDAVLTGIETRSSAPLRITRDVETLASTNVVGLYPCGEGSGYAGGIMSSAIDGINVAISIAKSMLNK